jgi:hypothetical protein
MATIRNFEVKSDQFNVCGMCSDVNYVQYRINSPPPAQWISGVLSPAAKRDRGVTLHVP